MDKIRDKYEIILGFVTLVISFSAFKEDLSKIIINLGYTSITLADYFICCICGLSICMYFFVLEKSFQDTKFSTLRFFDYSIKFAYLLYIFILFTPLILILNVLISQFLIPAFNYSEVWVPIANFVISFITLILTVYFYINKLKAQKERRQEQIELQEIKELDNSVKLFKDEYYSHSVLESFKVLESHLYKKLSQRNIRVQRYNFNEILKLAIKENIITDNDMPAIQDLRGMRNISAHLDTEHTKQQAEFALNFVKELLQRNNN